MRGMSIYDEIAKIDFKDLELRTMAGARQIGKSAMLAAGYGMSMDKFKEMYPPKPNPNELARQVDCPVCKQPKGKQCIDMTRWPRRNPGNKRRPYLWVSHEARISRAALVCEELT